MPESKLASRLSLLLIAVVALTAAFWGGTPDKLPGIALGSDFMLYLERGVAGFFTALLVVVIALRAWGGHLPDELSERGVKYVTRATADEIRDTTTEALERMAATQEELATRLAALEDASGQE